MNFGRIFAVVALMVAMSLLGGSSVLHYAASNPISYVSTILIFVLPFIITESLWGRKILESRPQLFWFVGGGMLALSIVCVAGFVALEVKYPSLPIDGMSLRRLLVLFFGAEIMILATPTIFVVTNALKRSKEKQ